MTTSSETLDRAKQLEFTDVVVLGFEEKEGRFCFFSNVNNPRVVLWLLEIARHNILKIDRNLHEK